MLQVYRVQDAEGRGPYKPGMSKRWVDEDGDPPPLPFVAEFGNGIIGHLNSKIDAYGGACGCACRSVDGLARWFTVTERPRLAALGYRIVSMGVNEVLAESEAQLVFWRLLPLRWNVTLVSW